MVRGTVHGYVVSERTVTTTKQSSVVRTYGYTANSGASAKQALREAYFRAEAVAQGAELLLCKREHLGVDSQPLQKQQSPAVPHV